MKSCTFSVAVAVKVTMTPVTSCGDMLVGTKQSSGSKINTLVAAARFQSKT
jgi:hypothetical protein